MLLLIFYGAIIGAAVFVLDHASTNLEEAIVASKNRLIQRSKFLLATVIPFLLYEVAIAVTFILVWGGVRYALCALSFLIVLRLVSVAVRLRSGAKSWMGPARSLGVVFSLVAPILIPVHHALTHS